MKYTFQNILIQNCEFQNLLIHSRVIFDKDMINTKMNHFKSKLDRNQPC